MLLSNIEKQSFLMEVLDELDIMIWIKDKDGNLIYINNMAKNALFNCTNDKDIDFTKCPLSCNVSDIVEKKEDVIEKVFCCGEEIFLNCQKIPLKQNNGGMMIIAEDITEKVLENEKNVKLLNIRIDEWKDRRKLKNDESSKSINKILSTIKDIKREKNLSYE